MSERNVREHKAFLVTPMQKTNKESSKFHIIFLFLFIQRTNVVFTPKQCPDCCVATKHHVVSTQYANAFPPYSKSTDNYSQVNSLSTGLPVLISPSYT